MKDTRSNQKNDETVSDSLKTRLIMAGIDDISANGIEKFSLRKIASVCHTSCAAPYKHFRNKEEFLQQTVGFILEKWELLRDEVLRAFAGDPHKQWVELSLAYIRFWVANPGYRTVLLNSGRVPASDACFHRLYTLCACRSSLSESEKALRELTFRSQLIGYIEMLSTGELPNTPATFSQIRSALEIR